MKPNHNENHDWNVNDQFSEDLKALFEPKAPVGAHIDRAVMDKAGQHLQHRSMRQWKYYWTTSAAAAIVIAAGILFLNFIKSSQPTSPHAPIALQEDINRDGTVNILDAFKLARSLDTDAPLNTQWDINADGVVNMQDVDQVALAAVQLKGGML